MSANSRKEHELHNALAQVGMCTSVLLPLPMNDWPKYVLLSSWQPSGANVALVEGSGQLGVVTWSQ